MTLLGEVSVRFTDSLLLWFFVAIFLFLTDFSFVINERGLGSESETRLDDAADDTVDDPNEVANSVDDDETFVIPFEESTTETIPSEAAMEVLLLVLVMAPSPS